MFFYFERNVIDGLGIPHYIMDCFQKCKQKHFKFKRSSGVLNLAICLEKYTQVQLAELQFELARK